MSLCEATTCVPIDMGIHICIYIYTYIEYMLNPSNDPATEYQCFI